MNRKDYPTIIGMSLILVGIVDLILYLYIFDIQHNIQNILSSPWIIGIFIFISGIFALQRKKYKFVKGFSFLSLIINGGIILPFIFFEPNNLLYNPPKEFLLVRILIVLLFSLASILSLMALILTMKSETEFNNKENSST